MSNAAITPFAWVRRRDAAIQYIARCIEKHIEPGQILAQRNFPPFWYKVFIFTPLGTVQFDTAGETLENKRTAKNIARRQGLTPTTLDELFTNWHIHGIGENLRPHGTKLLRLWEHTYMS